MVRDVHDALEQVLGDAPPWRRSLDDVVAAGRRARRRRRATVAAGSSAAAVLAAGTLLAAPRLFGDLRGPRDPTPLTSLNAAGPPTGPRPARSSPSDVPTSPRERFRRAGYSYADAVLLARLWGGGMTVDAAKVDAGQKLLDGGTMPVLPGQTPETVSDDLAMDAFFNHGYDYTDATRLAKLWHRTSAAAGSDLSQIKVAAGRRLLAGQALPR